MWRKGWISVILGGVLAAVVVGASGMATDRSIGTRVNLTVAYASAIDALESERLGKLIAQSLDDAKGQSRFHYHQTLKAFYQSENYTPQWLLSRKDLSAVLVALAEAPSHGLDPADYHPHAIARRLASRDAAQLVELELFISDALLAYARHLRVGRFSPAAVDEQWLIETDEFNPISLLERYARGESLQGLLAQLPPTLPAYDKLREKLPEFELLVARGGWPRLPGKGALKPGRTDPEVAILRARLSTETQFSLPSHANSVIGLGPKSDGESDINHYFDEALSNVLKDYQRQHGLEPDGILGPNTRDMLNVPAAERLHQIKANLERLRWLPRDLGDHYIWVDVAAFEMKVVREGRERLSMPTIVGREARATPVFSDEMTYLEFNPYWNVPLSIAMRDLVPAQAADPDYLVKKRVLARESWDGDAPTIPLHEIDWAYYRDAPWSEFPYHLRQEPGPGNALGVVKFMFPNEYGIYLHDTPEDQLFEKARRAFSSGCIRLAEPLRLAYYLLRDQDYEVLPEVPATARYSRWSMSAIQARVAGGVNESIGLKEPLKVYIVYFTAWVDDRGVIQFRDDLYERDDEVLEEIVDDN